MIRLENLSMSVGSFALQDISLHVRQGEYFVLFGRSGAGKTLLLESIAGLCRIDSGSVHLDDDEVTRCEPRVRGVGYLPQDFALFPNMSVFQNVAYGPKRKGMPTEDVHVLVKDWLGRLKIEHLADRRPGQLSGGERQRVALARAVAAQSRVLLLDEPTSALDEGARENVCRNIKNLHATVGATTIHVCHNFVEMLSVADRVGIIHEGRILQVGPPSEVLERPVSPVVASFVRAGNLFPGRMQLGPGNHQIELEDGRVLQVEPGAASLFQDDEAAMVMARPENVRIFHEEPLERAPGENLLKGTVAGVTDMGHAVVILVSVGEATAWKIFIGKREFREQTYAPGEDAWVLVSPEDLHIMHNSHTHRSLGDFSA